MNWSLGTLPLFGMLHRALALTVLLFVCESCGWLHSTAPSIRVWDGCFAARELDLVRAACAQRGHSFTSVYDRRPEDGPCRGGRTIIEAALNSLLDELDDDSRFVEFWYRDQWKPIDPHRDVDEALCRRIRLGPDGYGHQRCPHWGHVLYLDVASCVRAPTCILARVLYNMRDGRTLLPLPIT